MTNGEKIIELFPDLEIEYYLSVVKAYEWKFEIKAEKKWWESEYRKPHAESGDKDADSN